VKALSLDEVYGVCRPLVIDDASALKMGVEVAGLSLRINRVASPEDGLYRRSVIDILSLDNIDTSRLVMGKAQEMAGRASVEFVVKAAEMAMRGEVDGIVSPLNKEYDAHGQVQVPGT
jgi:4-hydroxythreonine-4-phosphate dehydrogenase